MKLFRRAGLLAASGALALGTLTGLTAAASPAYASWGPGPIQYHNPSPVYLLNLNPLTPCSAPLTVIGMNMTPPGSFDPVWVTLYREEPPYYDGTWADSGKAVDLGNGEFRWDEPASPGPGTYFASVYDLYGYHYSGTVTTVTC